MPQSLQNFNVRVVLTGSSQETFEKVVIWLQTDHPMHLTFLLGFYVSLVVKRWWEQYVKLPWPDEVAMLLKATITRGESGENLKIRKTVVRYMILSFLLCLRRISSSVRTRYPTMDHLVATQLISKDEVLKIGDEGHNAIQEHGKSNWWFPLKWSVNIVKTAMMEERAANAPSYAALVKSISVFRANLTAVLTYGHVTVPLVYTQVVHLAIYFYFAVALVGRQWIVGNDKDIDLYIPIFLIFEFLLYIGWLNVATNLYNPFGDDDDDFELVDLLNRHVKVCMSIVEEDDNEVPKIEDVDFSERMARWQGSLLVKS